MRATKAAPLVTGTLLLIFSFWSGECRSGNNEFFDRVSVDNSPWQPITNRDREQSQRPSSPKFPPNRFPNNNHPGSSPPHWHTEFSRPPTTEKFKDSFDRIGPNNKPKFTPPLVDGYKTYSPGPIFNFNKPELPFNHFPDGFKPLQDSNKPHGVKLVKENSGPVYKDPSEVSILGPKRSSTTPSTFDFPSEPNVGPASFSSHPANSYSDSRKKIKLPPSASAVGHGGGFPNEKLNFVKTNGGNGNRFPHPESDRNSVRDAPINETGIEAGAWEEHVHEPQNIQGNKHRGSLKFHPNGVAIREVVQAEAPVFESSTSKNSIQKLSNSQRISMNRTTSPNRDSTRHENKIGLNSANELKPNSQVIYSNTAQLVEDGPESNFDENEEFRPMEPGPGNSLKQGNQVRNRIPAIKPSQVDPVRTVSSEQTKVKPLLLTATQSPSSTTEKSLPQNELANTVPILESVQNNDFDKVREPSSASEETSSSENKKKFPLRRPQLLTTTSTEKPATFEPSRRPTLKPSLKTRLGLNQSSKFRSTTESITSAPDLSTEAPMKVKIHKEDGSVQSNDIPLKPSIRPMSDFNLRRRPVNKPNQNEYNIPPTGWALASLKNFNNTRSTRRPATDPPSIGVTELPAKIKPFVAWSTRLQKFTTTETSATEMTTLMDEDLEMETTTFAVDTAKNPVVISTVASSLNSIKNVRNSTVKTISISTTIASPEDINNIGNSEVNDEEISTMNSSINDKESSEMSPDDDENKTENISSPDLEEVNHENGPNNLNTNTDNDKLKTDSNNDVNMKNSNSVLKVAQSSKSESDDTLYKEEVKMGLDKNPIPNIKTSSSGDDIKLMENVKKQMDDEEMEFVEATNNSRGMEDTNDLKTKPVETIYLTDIKSGVVGLTNTVGPTFQGGKEDDISTVNNSSSHVNFVNTSRNESNTGLVFNNVPLLNSSNSVPFLNNYQNNSSQHSNELNIENDVGNLKGVSSQLDLHEQQFENKTNSNSSLGIPVEMENSSESIPDTKEVFSVSYDSPVIKTTLPTEGTKSVSISVTEAVSKKIELFSSTTSTPSNGSNEEIPDFEFSTFRPQSSSDHFESSHKSSTSNRPTTQMEVTDDESDKPIGWTKDSEMGTNLSEIEQSPKEKKSTPKIPNTTSVSILSSFADTSVELAEKTNQFDANKPNVETTSEIFDLSSRSSSTEATVPGIKWTGIENPKTTSSQPFNSIERTTRKNFPVSVVTIPSTVKPSSSGKQDNTLPPVSDKFDENGVTDEDVYIETDGEHDPVVTIAPTKTMSSTTKVPDSNMSTEVTETPLCPSNSMCPVPLHVQLQIEASQSEVCRTQDKLENSIIKLFRSGTERVHLPNQIKFINLNSKECSKDDSDKVTEVSFYLADGKGTYEQSINEEFVELWRKMRHLDYEPKVQNAHLVMNKDNGSKADVSDMDHSKTRVIAAVVIICLALICLILVILLLMIIRKRQKRFNYGQRCVPVTLDDYSLDNISVYNSVRRKGDARASKRSYGNPAFDDPNGPSHRMNFAGLANFTSDQNAMDEEFAGIPVVAVKPDELPPSAETKNRYANVIPLPETRVHLLNQKNGGCSDYINANYVKGPKRADKFYIACQAPLQSTIEDFWRMIWEQQSKVILMLTDFFENGVEKCANYLPPSEVIDCHRVFGDFQVTLKKRENREKYIISSLQLKNLETNSWREVTHLWYTSWPPLGVPNEESSVIAFLIEARVYMKNNTGPIVVHCSPGTGRTGTVIACDLCIRDFELTRMFDVPKTVYMLRRCRAGAVQTKQQYAFIYKVLNLYAAKLTGGGLDSI